MRSELQENTETLGWLSCDCASDDGRRIVPNATAPFSWPSLI